LVYNGVTVHAHRAPLNMLLGVKHFLSYSTAEVSNMKQYIVTYVDRVNGGTPRPQSSMNGWANSESEAKGKALKSIPSHGTQQTIVAVRQV
jgi:hypothetical protein